MVNDLGVYERLVAPKTAWHRLGFGQDRDGLGQHRMSAADATHAGAATAPSACGDGVVQARPVTSRHS